MNPLVVEDRTLTFNSDMGKWIQRALSASLLLGLVGSAFSDPLIYQQEFVKEVYKFANLNRLQTSRLHRDVHADCFILVTIATVIRSDGSVKDVSVLKSSSVPIVDRYFRYVIEQSAPFQPFASHYDPVPEEITVTQEFRLDVMLWTDGVRATRPCVKVKPRDSQPN